MGEETPTEDKPKEDAPPEPANAEPDKPEDKPDKPEDNADKPEGDAAKPEEGDKDEGKESFLKKLAKEIAPEMKESLMKEVVKEVKESIKGNAPLHNKGPKMEETKELELKEKEAKEHILEFKEKVLEGKGSRRQQFRACMEMKEFLRKNRMFDNSLVSNYQDEPSLPFELNCIILVQCCTNMAFCAHLYVNQPRLLCSV